MKSYNLWRLVIALSILCAVTAPFGANPFVSHVRATTPCDDVVNDPNPPGGDPELEISGSVTDSFTLSAFQGAEMKLYSCSGATATLVTSTTTDSYGHYAFTSLTDETWYYVAAVMTGSLAGKSPTGATTNPTNAIGLGNSATNVNFTFH